MNKKQRKEYLDSLPSRSMTDEEWYKYAEKEVDIEELRKESEELEKSGNKVNEKEKINASEPIRDIIRMLE